MTPRQFKQICYYEGRLACEYCGVDLRFVNIGAGSKCLTIAEELKRFGLSTKAELKQVHATTDHIIPKSKGGTNAKHNYKICCQRCNTIKANGSEEELYQKLIDKLV